MNTPCPVYDRDGITLYHGDCRDVLPTLDSVSVIVSDPPYGIGFVKKDTGRGVVDRWSCHRNAGPIGGDDVPFDPSHLFGWPCVLFGGNHFYDRLPPGGSFHGWDKRAHSSLDDSFSDIEFIWTSRPCKSRIISHLWKGVQQDSEKGRRKYHVSQKPVVVMRQLIEWFATSDDVICDPYAGSGSTGVACYKMGRRCVLIESDPRYIPIIIRRLRDAETPLLSREFRP